MSYKHISPVQPTRSLFQNAALSPLGGITLCGFIQNCTGVKESPRIYGKYALVYILSGEGTYIDRNLTQRLEPGDAIMVFPDLPHWYGPPRGETWDELYMIFEGPIFETWQLTGILNPAAPIRHLEPFQYWLDRIVLAAGDGNDGNIHKAYGEVLRLQELMVEMFVPELEAGTAEYAWLEKAKVAIARFPDDRSAARELNVSYETFRKRFTQLLGWSPSKYRTSQVIAEACKLLGDRTLLLREIAARLGFCDEFHFSNRFKKIIGISPSEFRLRYMHDVPPGRS